MAVTPAPPVVTTRGILRDQPRTTGLTHTFFISWRFCFESFLNFLQHWVCFMVFFFSFWLWSVWGLSSLTRDQTCTPCSGRQCLNPWTAKEVTKLHALDRSDLVPHGALNSLVWWKIWFFLCIKCRYVYDICTNIQCICGVKVSRRVLVRE